METPEHQTEAAVGLSAVDRSVGRRVWLLTTGTGADGDEWNVESIHATEPGAQMALERYQQPQRRHDGSTYVRDANIEEWEVEE